MTVPAERLAEAVAAAGPVLVDVGCGDGRHTVRWAERRPDALVVGLDAETTRLDRSGAVARKRKLAVVFVTAVAEHPPEPLRGRCAEIAVVMPWGSLLDGILGADPDVRNGFSGVSVSYQIDADATAEEIRALVAQSQKRSAVYDIVTNPVSVTVDVA